MKFGRLGTELKHGYNAMMTRESDMLMDIGYQVMDANEIIELEDPFQESAFVILTGEVEIRWDDKREVMRRESLIDENPFCLQVPRAKKVIIKAKIASEVLIQKTMNDRDFAPVFYRPEDVQCDIFGQGMWNATAERTVRTIFDYGNAPFSNQVNGEVINSPGRWSGYIPHNSWSEISGGLMHPQVTAPGYAMWYSWMIRHLPDEQGGPWKKTPAI